MRFDQHEEVPLEMAAAQAALEKLRAREGLQTTRLRALPRPQGQGLLELRSVRMLSARASKDPVVAAIELAQHCIVHELSGTNAIVADAIFGTGLFRAEYSRAQVPDQTLAKLYAANLMVRRRALLDNWHRLHAARQAPLVHAPSERSLRGRYEADAIMQLAAAIWRSRPDSAPGQAPPNGGSAAGKVVIIGGAVMDVSFRLRSMPSPNGFEEAVASEFTPGGKGVTQAVAAARLGLRTTLVTAVGDDAFGAEIIEFLTNEGVDTSHVKVAPDARSPLTAVLNRQIGGTSAISWRNKHRVRLETRDIDRVRDEMLQSDVLMLTFEPPTSVVEYVLHHCLADREPRPVTIVSTAPPYSEHSISRQAMANIDYLVPLLEEIPSLLSDHADPDLAEELGEFTEGVDNVGSMARIADRLLSIGVGTVCVPINGACAVYAGRAGNFHLPSLIRSFRLDPAGARDAFCAALASRVHHEREEIDIKDVALWATAAMAAASADHGVARSMPRQRQIEATLRRTLDALPLHSEAPEEM